MPIPPEVLQIAKEIGSWGPLLLILWIFRDYIRFSFGRPSDPDERK